MEKGKRKLGVIGGCGFSDKVSDKSDCRDKAAPHDVTHDVTCYGVNRPLASGGVSLRLGDKTLGLKMIMREKIL